jgi:hypothetical protein
MKIADRDNFYNSPLVKQVISIIKIVNPFPSSNNIFIISALFTLRAHRLHGIDCVAACST